MLDLPVIKTIDIDCMCMHSYCYRSMLLQLCATIAGGVIHGMTVSVM